MSDAANLPHTLSLSERKKLTMTGALEVVSFEESFVVLKTALVSAPTFSAFSSRELVAASISSMVVKEAHSFKS